MAFGNSLGKTFPLSSAQLGYFLLSPSGSSFDATHLRRMVDSTILHSALGAHLHLSPCWGSGFSLFNAFAALFVLHQGMCCELETPRNKKSWISFIFPQELSCPTQDCSMHFGSVTPTTILQLRLTSKAELSLLLSLGSHGTAGHISRHRFVLWLENTALTRAE